MVVDQGDQRASLLGRKLQPPGDRSGHGGAGLLVMAPVAGLARVMHQERKVERARVLAFLEEPAVAPELRVFGVDQGIEFVDADQRVLVCRVAMEKFMLHKAGQPPEFGQITPEKIRLVHHAQDAADLSLARENGEKHLPGGAGILEGAVDHTESLTHEIDQRGGEGEVAQLGVLEQPHQPLRVLGENAGRLGVEQTVLGEKSVEVLGPRSPRGEESEKPGRGRGRIHRRGHLGQGCLGDALDVAGVLVILAHEGFHPLEHVLLGISQPGGDLALQKKRQGVDRALVDEMHLGAHTEEKIIGLLEQAPVALGQDFFLHQLGRGVGPAMKGSDPDQVLIVPQAAGSMLDVRLLHRGDASVLAVEFLLVGQTPGDVVRGFSPQALLLEFLAELGVKVAIPAEVSRLEHGGLGLQVLVGLADRLGHRADGMADLEPDVPEYLDHLLDGLGLLAVRPRAGVEKHDVHVAERIHFTPAVAAEGEDGKPRGLRPAEDAAADLRVEAAEK